jgi:hypothetical protein
VSLLLLLLLLLQVWVVGGSTAPRRWREEHKLPEFEEVRLQPYPKAQYRSLKPESLDCTLMHVHHRGVPSQLCSPALAVS